MRHLLRRSLPLPALAAAWLAFGGDLAGVYATAGDEGPGGAVAAPSGDGGDEAPPRLALPPRPAAARGGREVLEGLAGETLDALEDAVVAEIESGNVPAALRNLTPVELRATPGASLRIWVMKDYLSVGSDDDFVRVPLRAAAAERLADELDALLPTKVVVDAIAAQADAHLPPEPPVPHPSTLWRAQALAHDAALDRLARRFDAEPGALVAGPMKDVVISPTLAAHPRRLAIYGLHGLDGEVVQPLSVAHVRDYVDYSQGVRLVARAAERDGHPVDLAELLADEGRCQAISPEGPIELPAYR